MENSVDRDQTVSENDSVDLDFDLYHTAVYTLNSVDPDQTA